MFVDIMIGLFFLVFLILAYFIVQTLVKLQITLQNTNRLMTEIQFKVDKIDPLLNSLSNAGDILEDKTSSWKQNYFEMQQVKPKDADLYDWTLLTVSLVKNYLKRGKNG